MKIRTIPTVAAIVTLAIHAIGNPHYGFFRDELYFIVCGFHPDWGYVDQPPVVPLLAAGSQLFGHSLFLLRLLPALFAAGGAYVTCLLAIELGGGRFAQIAAGIGFLAAPVLTSFGSKVGPDMVGLWLWPLMALYVLRLVKGADPRWWLAVGAVAGICLQSKYSVLFFIVAMGVGLLLVPQRKVFATRWFLAGCGLAMLIALPNFIWQAVHGFPMIELLRNGQNGKNSIAGPLLYLLQQALLTNIFLLPLWIGGLVTLFRSPVARFLGYTYVVIIALMILAHGKHYYPADVYPIVIAAGGVTLEAWTRRAALLRPVLAVVMAWAALVFMPFSLPFLSEQPMVAYATFLSNLLHVGKATMATESHRSSVLPEDWADMHGWPELAETVSKIYWSLPPDQRAQTVIAASNYGEAAALDFFGGTYGLPTVISGHNNYWLWGTHGASGNVLIDVNGDCGASMHLYRQARKAATFDPPWVISYEQNIPIMVCAGITRPLASIWPSVRFYI